MKSLPENTLEVEDSHGSKSLPKPGAISLRASASSNLESTQGALSQQLGKHLGLYYSHLSA